MSTYNNQLLETDIPCPELFKEKVKKCPKCGNLILKVSGYDKVICPNPKCQTVFDWNTLHIDENASKVFRPSSTYLEWLNNLIYKSETI